VVSMGEADYKDFISKATVTALPLAKGSETGVGLRTVVDSLSAGIPVRARLLFLAAYSRHTTRRQPASTRARHASCPTHPSAPRCISGRTS
jgi:hypothetical protein